LFLFITNRHFFPYSFSLVAKSFAQQLVRQTSLSHLAQAARTVMTNIEVVTQMAMDFREIPFDYLTKQVAWINAYRNNPGYDIIIHKCN